MLELELGYDDALAYFTTMASLSRLLNDPSMIKFLENLKTNEERTVGDLIAFMDAYNLRFGRAASNRQIEIYTGLFRSSRRFAIQSKPRGLFRLLPIGRAKGSRQPPKKHSNR